MQGYVGKFFVTLAVVVSASRKIGTHCVDVGGPVFDVVLYFPSISRSRCLIQKFCRNLKYKFLTGGSKLHFR